MRLRMIIGLLALAVLVWPAASIPARAQPPIPPLPADLLFTASLTAGQGDFPRDVILRVDAETLEVSPFYVDAEAIELMPLSWSPQDDLLAIYRIMPPIDESWTLFPRQLCILNRAGELQGCLNENPALHDSRSIEGWAHYFPATWSADGQSIYFYTEYPSDVSPNGFGRRLVEASVITGETLRVMYDDPYPFPLVLSPDLRYVGVGLGLWWGPGSPTYLYDLITETLFDITTSVPAHSNLSIPCLPFSPGGNYLAALAEYELAAYAPEQDPTLNDGRGLLLVILNNQGAIQHVIGEPNGENTLWDQSCPGWQANEQAIYFWAADSEKAYIMRYSLSDHQLTTLYEIKDWPERESYINVPLIPSPSGSHIALTVSDLPQDARQVAVLYPDGEIYRIPSPYRFGLYPLWVPE